MRYSVIIPVYNRPDEVDELLQSLTAQYFKDFEVVVVEDGSSIPCKEVTDRYIDRLNIKYFSKPNSAPEHGFANRDWYTIIINPYRFFCIVSYCRFLQEFFVIFEHTDATKIRVLSNFCRIVCKN